MEISPLVAAFAMLLLLQTTYADYRKCSGSFTNYAGSFKVFRVFATTWKDLQAIEKLKTLTDDSDEIDFWLDARRPGHFSDIMVSPKSLHFFCIFLAAHKLNYSITVDDVQRLIFINEHHEANALERRGRKHRKQWRWRRNAAEESRKNLAGSHRNESIASQLLVGLGRPFERIGLAQGARYQFGQYSNYAAMTRFMRTLQFYYPHLVELIQLGKTHEGRSLEGVKIGYPVTNNAKPSIWIDGNMHAREWASSHTALFIINQLVSAYGKERAITNYLNAVNFYIVPCANPDGYEYSRSSLKPQIRLWRKNRSPSGCITYPRGESKCCQGTDLNRNFDFHWSEVGSSSNPCSNLFAGNSAFSEPETRAISDFLLYAKEFKEPGGQLSAFITLHTYAQLWIHPYSHEPGHYPQDIARLVEKVYGTRYQVGTGADLLAPASGGSDDWAKEKLNVKYVFLVELRPKLQLSNGFILKPDELIPTAIETFEGIKAVIDAVLEDMNSNNAASSPQSPLDRAPRVWPQFVNSTIGKWNSPDGHSRISISSPSQTTLVPPPGLRISLAERQRLSEELLRKQLLRIRQLSSTQAPPSTMWTSTRDSERASFTAPTRDEQSDLTTAVSLVSGSSSLLRAAMTSDLITRDNLGKPRVEELGQNLTTGPEGPMQGACEDTS